MAYKNKGRTGRRSYGRRKNRTSKKRTYTVARGGIRL